MGVSLSYGKFHCCIGCIPYGSIRRCCCSKEKKKENAGTKYVSAPQTLEAQPQAVIIQPIQPVILQPNNVQYQQYQPCLPNNVNNGLYQYQT